MMLRALACLCAATLLSPAAHAWDAHGHRTIALLAIDQFAAAEQSDKNAKPGELDWLFATDSRTQVGYQSGEPDRYRAIRSPYLKHLNDPDHYLDVDDLEQFGLTLQTIPPLRYEYLRALAIAKHEHPENMKKPYNARTDPARTQEWPGYLPYSITEHYGKLISSFRQIRVLEKLNDPARAPQLAAARANVIFEMGQLAHFVGDAAQPLHTTEHHHGWVGDNPSGFTTNRGFHAYIDGTILGIHTLNYDTLKSACTATRTISPNDPAELFSETLAHIQRSFDQVRPLYELQKSGELEKDAGKVFITERLCDGASMLGALYFAAWQASAMTDKDAQDFIKYDQISQPTPNPMDGAKRTDPPTPTTLPAVPPASEPAPAPAPTPPTPAPAATP